MIHSENNNIIDDLPIYIWQKDKNSKLVFCNKKYAEIFNVSIEEAIRKNMVLKPTNSKRTHIIIKGERKLLEISENKHSISWAIDVTEEESIKKEHEIYKKQTIETFNYISVPIAIFDVNKKLIFANEATKKLFEFDDLCIASEHYMSDILDTVIEKQKIMPTSDYPEFKKKINNFFIEVISPHHEFMHTPDGRSLNIIISPNYGGGLIFIFEDITEKIKLERKYKALSAVQRETLNHLHEAILVFGADNRLRMTNPAINKMWNKTGNQEGLHIKDFFSNSYELFLGQDDCELWISHVINMGEKRIEFLGTFDFKDGRHIDYAYVPLPDGLSLIRFIDITDRIELEKNLLEKTKILTEVDRLKSSFITNVSCELNSPINTIYGFTDVLINQYFGELNNRQLEYCKGILQNVKKLSELIESMINLSTIETGHMKIHYVEVDVKELINESISLFMENAKTKNITLDSYINNNDNSTIYIDKKSIKQAIFQILSKVLKITQFNGNVTLSCIFPEEISDYVEISIQSTNNEILLEEIEKIENELKQCIEHTEDKNTFGAVDFGLVFANSVINMHNGKMYVIKLQEGGLEVGFRIPAKPFFIEKVKDKSAFSIK